MDERPEPGSSGWSFGKVVGAIVGLIGMVGFGVCSICGLAMGAGGHYGDVMFFVIVGAVLAFLFGWLAATMFRKAREERENRRVYEARDTRDP